jgi:hypothetical protein
MIVKPCQVILIEDQNKNDSNCLVLNFSFSMHMMNNGDDTKISSSIKDFAFYGSNFEQLKDSKVEYSVRIFISILFNFDFKLLNRFYNLLKLMLFS